MGEELLNTREAAQRLGIATASLYEWLAQSNAGAFLIGGRPVTIDYLQSGPRGQGRIKIESREIDRLKNLMRVRPQTALQRKPPIKTGDFPGITVKLGRPAV